MIFNKLSLMSKYVGCHSSFVHCERLIEPYHSCGRAKALKEVVEEMIGRIGGGYSPGLYKLVLIDIPQNSVIYLLF